MECNVDSYRLWTRHGRLQRPCNATTENAQINIMIKWQISE